MLVNTEISTIYIWLYLPSQRHHIETDGEHTLAYCVAPGLRAHIITNTPSLYTLPSWSNKFCCLLVVVVVVVVVVVAMKSPRRGALNNNGEMIDSVSARNLNYISGWILLENLLN